MKKINYAFAVILAACFAFSVSSCNNTPTQTSSGKDTVMKKPVNLADEIKKIQFEKDDDTVAPRNKLIFVDKNSSTFLPEDIKRYRDQGYETYDKGEFDTHFEYFQTLFKIDKADEIIKNYMPFPYSIYEMYSTKLQHDLSLQDETTLSGGVNYENRIRIYPAIDRTSSVLYLVLLGELRKPGSKPSTLRSTYFTIKAQVFSNTSNLDTIASIEADIRNFQSIWNSMSVPGYKFAACTSFVYSIASYNQLLSSPSPFWNLYNCRTDATKANMNVMLIPVVDNSDSNNVNFSLVSVVHKKIGLSYYQQNTNEFFDNMDVCPKKCPSNSIQ